MAKKTLIEFEIADAPRPDRMGDARMFSLRTPVPLSLPVGTEVTVDLGVRCKSHPLVMFGARGLVERGVRLLSAGVVDAGLPLKVTLKNEGKETQHFSVGETVCRAAALDNADVSF